MLLFDWIAREGWIVIAWWLLVTAAGAAVFPMCLRLLGGLPDRGYIFARSLGLLLVGFVFWLLASVGFLRNSAGSVTASWLIVMSISLFVYYRLGEPIRLRDWWRENKRVVIVAEALFFLLLVSWALVRAHHNHLTGTEKPMELAFMSAIQRSESFPPNDPWMAGYSISYYYFGYVQSSMLSILSGVSSTVGFNMTTALLFALTGLNTFGVVYNLVRSRSFRPGGIPDEIQHNRNMPFLFGLLGVVFVILLGNFQLPLVEAPYQSRSMPASYFDIWGTQERLFLPPERFPAQPQLLQFRDVAEWDNWWWFRASRVLTDFQLDGSLPPEWHAQPIDEFPQFSFLLADNHPHVLALPYAVLALGLALNLLLTWRDPTRYEVLLYGIVLGGLVFLNTWDGPIYMAALVGTDALRRVMRSGDGRLYLADFLALIKLGAMIALITLFAYLPFFISFRSQAGGILPNLIYPTAPGHYFLMFGPFILLLVPFLLLEIWRARRLGQMNWRIGFSTASILLAMLFLAMLLLTLLGAVIPSLRGVVENFVQQNGGWENILPLLLVRRLTYGLTILVLLFAVIVVVGRLFPILKIRDNHDAPGSVISYPPATGFVLLLIGIGVTLSLIPEFFYLRDNFGTRINTIFKFYYQTWVVFSLASAYAVYSILMDRQQAVPGRFPRFAFTLICVLVLFAGLLYPALGIYSRTAVEGLHANSDVYSLPPASEQSPLLVSDGQFVQAGDLLIQQLAEARPAERAGLVTLQGDTLYVRFPLTLDGGPSMVSADDYAALQCLSSRVGENEAVAVEAVLRAYDSGYGRVGSITGIPIVLGWENHQRQWRGPTYDDAAGTRKPDIDRLYTDLRWDVALSILRRYDIDYVFYGTTERTQYGLAGEQKFLDNLSLVCESGDTRVYFVGENVMFDPNQ